jgi:hypothetical protein
MTRHAFGRPRVPFQKPCPERALQLIDFPALASRLAPFLNHLILQCQSENFWVQFPESRRPSSRDPARSAAPDEGGKKILQLFCARAKSPYAAQNVSSEVPLIRSTSYRKDDEFPPSSIHLVVGGGSKRNGSRWPCGGSLHNSRAA